MTNPTIQRGYQSAPEGRAGTLPSADETLRQMEWDKSEKINEGDNELVRELKIPLQLANLLAKAGVDTVEKLRKKDRTQTLGDIEGIGKGNVRSLHLALERGEWNKGADAVKAKEKPKPFGEFPKQQHASAVEPNLVFRDSDGGFGLTEQEVIRAIMDRVKDGTLDGRDPYGAIKPDANTVLRHLRKAIEMMGREFTA